MAMENMMSVKIRSGGSMARSRAQAQDRNDDTVDQGLLVLGAR